MVSNDLQGSTSLPRRVPAINLHIRCRHEAARIAEQEHGRAAILSRLTQLAEHILRGPVPPPLGVLLEERLHHGRHNVPRRDGVYADPELAPLGREIARQLDDARLGRIVGRADEALQKERRLAEVTDWSAFDSAASTARIFLHEDQESSPCSQPSRS